MYTRLDGAILDPDRLDQLFGLKLLDTPPDEPFDRLTLLASRVLGAPIALVSLVDDHRQFFKSACGLPEPWVSTRETPLSHSFCKHVVADRAPLVIEDARLHPLVRDNPAVAELNIIAYLGVPLVTPTGSVLGSFCVIACEPRAWTAADISTMHDLAASVMSEIALLHAVDELKATSSKLVRHEISVRRRVELELRTSELRLAKLAAAAPGVIYSFRMAKDGGYSLPYASAAILDTMGFAPDDVKTDATPIFLNIFPDDLDHVNATIQCSAKAMAPWQAEFRYQHPTKGQIWLEGHSNPVREENGALIWHGFMQDISQRKQAESRVELLMHEVNHRAKNLLEVVQSVAFQTAKGSDPLTFFRAFSDRIEGLAACHSLLVESAWEPVGVAELVQSQLSHYEHLFGSRIHYQGTAIKLKATAAQPVTMALHELATNAAKFGALSGATGEIHIAWENDRQFKMSWRECSGAPIAPPSRCGFGQRVIVSMIEHELQAKVSLRYPPTGVVWEIVAPVEHTCKDKPSEVPDNSSIPLDPAALRS